MTGTTTSPDGSTDAPAPPDLNPPDDAAVPPADAEMHDTGTAADAGSPSPASPGFDYDAFARANAAAMNPLLAQFAPKPVAPKQPWDDPDYYGMAGVPQERLSSEYQKRMQAHVEHLADSRADAKIAALKDEIRGAFQGQAAMFQSQFARDPGFVKVQAHYEKYMREGARPEHARRLAEQDAGVSRAPAAATGAKPMNRPPGHSTPPGGRQTPGQSTRPKVNIMDPKATESRFYEIAAQQGWDV